MVNELGPQELMNRVHSLLILWFNFNWRAVKSDSFAQSKWRCKINIKSLLLKWNKMNTMTLSLYLENSCMNNNNIFTHFHCSRHCITLCRFVFRGSCWWMVRFTCDLAVYSANIINSSHVCGHMQHYHPLHSFIFYFIILFFFLSLLLRESFFFRHLASKQANKTKSYDR